MFEKAEERRVGDHWRLMTCDRLRGWTVGLAHAKEEPGFETQT